MRWTPFALIALTVSVMAGCATPPPVAVKPTDPVCVADRDDWVAVSRVRSSFVLSLNKGDLDAVMKLLYPSAVAVGPDVRGHIDGSPAINDAQRMREFLGKRFIEQGLQMQAVGVVGAANMNCDTSVSGHNFTVRRGEASRLVPVAFTLHKTDGEWKIWLLSFGELP